MWIQSLCTVADENDWTSLQCLLQSICIYNPFIPIFINTTKQVADKIMSSNLSDGRIQIKLKLSEPSQALISDIIEIALERHTNTCYINVNSFFCKDIKNINMDNGFSGTIIKKSNNNKTIYMIVCNNIDTLSEPLDNNNDEKNALRYTYVDIDNATYDMDTDAENIMVFLSNGSNHEHKFYNNYVKAIFKKYVSMYIKI